VTPESAAIAMVRPFRLPPDLPPTLFVVVDTEEEFDWHAPFSRANTSVRAIRRVVDLQRILNRFRLRPIYVIDFPVASQADGFLPIREIAADGACEIGAHLHPWVNPPHRESLSGPNSFACNLPSALEAEKIRVLKDEIGANLGCTARTYKAGRYGAGPSTFAALERLGFDIDLSVNPHMDFSTEGGPSFRNRDASPFVFGQFRPLLEIPCTTGYTGIAGAGAAMLYDRAETAALKRVGLVSILSRLGIANKVTLSPEGHTLGELKALTRTLVGQGIRTFTLSLHSPSLQPECTPYVRTEKERRRFLATIEAYCEFFVGEMTGVSGTPEVFWDAASQPGNVRGGSAS
jgi:hypothetical protein